MHTLIPNPIIPMMETNNYVFPETNPTVLWPVLKYCLQGWLFEKSQLVRKQIK